MNFFYSYEYHIVRPAVVFFQGILSPTLPNLNNGSFVYERNKDNSLILFMHLGVVKVGLLWLAKPEVINLHLILEKKQLDVR